jgi:hypothetical protein
MSSDDDQRFPVPAAAHREPALPELELTPRLRRRVDTLERSGERLVKSAGVVGVDITYLGIAPLFAEPTAYAGELTDWVIGPVVDHTDSVIPQAERERLVRLVKAGLDFPLVYVAHEVPKGRLPLGGAPGERSRPVTVDRATAAAAVGPAPLAPETAAAAERLGGSSRRILTVLRKAAPIAAGVVAVPVVAAAAVAAAPIMLAAGLLAGLDPIVFGVIPANPGAPRPGEPAAWYILAQWNWAAGPAELGQ